MKVLLFGGSGMVGKELTRALASHTVIAPPHARVDITDAAAVERVVAEEKPGFIINAAVVVDVGNIEQDSTLAMRVNVQGAAIVARAAAARVVPQLFVSSSYVFCESVKTYTEDAAVSPQNVYGNTKVKAEEAVLTCGSKAPCYIARTSWIYSLYRDTFVDKVAQTILQGRTFEASGQRGNPTNGGEFAKAIVKYFIDSSTPSGVYHIVNEGSASRYEIALEIASILRVSKSLIAAKNFPSSATRPSVVLANTKLPKLPPWEESLREYIVAKYGQERGS